MTNLELNFTGENLPFAVTAEKIETQIFNLTPQKAYENACKNLQQCKGQQVVSFSIFPESVKKAFDENDAAGIIIFDTANQDLTVFEEFVSKFPSQKIFLGTSSLQKNYEKNLDLTIKTVQKYKKKFFIRLCEDLFSAGNFCSFLKQNSEVLFADDCGLFEFGGGVTGLSLLDKEEIFLLANRNVSCIFAPTATLMQGFEPPGLYTFYKKDAKVCIATDNLFSGSFNLETEIKLASLLVKSQMRDSTLFSFEELFNICQENAVNMCE